MRTFLSELFDPKMPRWWKWALFREATWAWFSTMLSTVAVALRILFLWSLVAFGIYLFAQHMLPSVPYDDTDPPGARSGLRLYTDAKTGCQYIGSGFLGAPTPRLDVQGKHICGVQP